MITIRICPARHTSICRRKRVRKALSNLNPGQCWRSMWQLEQLQKGIDKLGLQTEHRVATVHDLAKTQLILSGRNDVRHIGRIALRISQRQQQTTHLIQFLSVRYWKSCAVFRITAALGRRCSLIITFLTTNIYFLNSINQTNDHAEFGFEFLVKPVSVRVPVMPYTGYQSYLAGMKTLQRHTNVHILFSLEASQVENVAANLN